MQASGLDRGKLKQAIDEGWTLPVEWYSNPAVHDLDLQEVFRRTWQYAGREVDLPHVGSYATRSVGEIPTVIVRGKDDQLRAFVNVCRHRFNRVAQGDGTTKVLQCRYHGWTYGLDGRLQGAARHAKEDGFDRSCFGLVPLKLELMNGLIFVNVDLDAAPLADSVGGLPELLTERQVDFSGLELREMLEHEVGCNWKVYMEGASECYHCPTVHTDFAKVVDVDPEHYREYQEARVWAMMAGLKGDPPEVAHPNRYQFYSIWPNTIIAPEFMPKAGTPRIGRIFTFQPLGPDKCVVNSDLFCAPDVSASELEEYKKFWYQVMYEDFAMCANTHAGIRSGRVPQGRLMLESEGLIRTWYQRYFECIEGRLGEIT